MSDLLENSLPGNQNRARESENLHEAEVALQHWFFAKSHKILIVSGIAFQMAMVNGRAECSSFRSVFELHRCNLTIRKRSQVSKIFPGKFKGFASYRI